jgi:hypothetical protein
MALLSGRLRRGTLAPRPEAHATEERLMVTRTTHRSTAGKKLYAVRDKNGRFLDIQTYERAHRADLAKKSKAETARKK